ncbi:porin family protein [Dysgonomonas sp. ZJ279]|uniref:porin family protein n=1 Tax=Dysgonomonas sp. ZJ279 TaxID=2709796 RepID=UPI0013EAC78B|nr:porin family protein [Dysgonomonas sp. ZJ279]
MKKLIAITVALYLVATLSAQIRFGVKAGGNFSNLYTSGDNKGINADQYKGRFSYHFGGLAEYSFTDMLAIQPELTYINHGANLKKTNSFGMTDGHITLNSIQLPVNLKASFKLGENRVFAYGGPYVSYNIYGRARGKIDGKTESVELFSKGSDMKRWDYGVGVGVGLEINKFVLTLGNQFGLADINGAEGSKMKAGNITLSAGYFF